MTRTIRAWAHDLGFGIRLALGGRRPPWGRLTLTAVGIGLGVAVLLLASSVQNMIDARDHRQAARATELVSSTATAPPPGRTSLLSVALDTEFRDMSISGKALDPQRPDAPAPPGVQRIPGPGEIVVSPALERILNGPDGPLLRPRLSGKVIGSIAEEGLSSPDELYFYTGIDGLSPDADRVGWIVDGFGRQPQQPDKYGGDLWFLLALGVTALLVPVVVFVASTTRLAESARQRRLAALRLVGASAKQVRRIASGEALVGALLGIVVGWALFLVGRMLADEITIGEFTVFSGDISPTWWYALLITVAIPIIAVGTAVASQRRTAVEPLGVVRQTTSVRRRFGWRCAPIVLGAAGVLLAGRVGTNDFDGSVLFVGSVALLLIGVPLLLPWIVERVVGRLRGGALPWQLAIRRLQLTTGTAARSVSAIAVVLTGVIGLQTVMATVEANRFDKPPTSKAQHEPNVEVAGNSAASNQTDDGVRSTTSQGLAAIPGVSKVDGVSQAYLDLGDGSHRPVTIADCQTLMRITGAPRCSDGDAFYAKQVELRTQREQGRPLQGGEEWPLKPSLFGPSGSGSASARAPTWRVPDVLQPLDTPQVNSSEYSYSTLVLTPRAAEGIPPWAREVEVNLSLDPAAPPDTLELIRNAAAQNLGATSRVTHLNEPSSAFAVFTVIRYGLLLGALVTFTLIGCSLFVSAAEQIQERRRPLAVLGAVGVPRATMAWSALLQNWLLMLMAVAVAVVVGMLLGVLVVVGVSENGLAFDIFGLLGMLGIATVSVLVVTALTLPGVARAMHPEGLRTE